MAHLKEFSRASALPTSDDDEVDIPDTILWDLAGVNVTSHQEGGLPDIMICDDDDDSYVAEEPVFNETLSAESIPMFVIDHESLVFSTFAARPNDEDFNLAEIAENSGTGLRIGATIDDFPDDWDIIGEDTGSGLGNDPGQWAPKKLPDVVLPDEAGPIEIHGNAFGNLIVGADAKEVIYGHAGDDILSGNGGNDHLIGGFGDDTLLGGDFGDTLRGGPGNDTLTGGNGPDRFVFLDHTENPGIDTITDFEPYSSLPHNGDRFGFDVDNLAIAAGETARQNVIALEGDGGAELWADTKHFGLTQIALVENLTAVELEIELDFAVF